MANTEIRVMMLSNNLRQYMVAKELGTTEFTFSRWLRDELPPKKKKEVIEAIKRLSANKNKED